MSSGQTSGLGKAAKMTSAREVVKFCAKKKPVTARQDQNIQDICKTLAKERIGALLVTNKEGEVVGVVSERDIVFRLAETEMVTEMFIQKATKVQDIMTPNFKIISCKLDDSVHTVMELMLQNNIRHLGIRDDDNKLVAFVSMKDALACVNQDTRDEGALKNYFNAIGEGRGWGSMASGAAFRAPETSS